MTSTHATSEEVRTTVRRNIKRINRWRGLGVQWKPILKMLDLSCSVRTLTDHYNYRGMM